MSIESQVLYNQSNLASWKTSYPLQNVKDVPEPPIQNCSYFSRFIPSDKLLKKYSTNKSNKYAWQISISPNGAHVVILKNNNLELRSSKSDFNQIVFQCQIYKDYFPQWRTISWSSSSNLFGVSFSNGSCSMWDLQGSKLSLHTNCARINDFDVIVKMLILEVSKAKEKLYIFTLNGKLLLYDIHNFKPSNNYKSNINFLSSPILCCESLNNSDFVVIGTYNQYNNMYGNIAFNDGIVLCRLVDESPFIVSNLSRESSSLRTNSWYSFFTNKKSSDAVYMIRISKDSSKLAALHISGKLSVWNFPSLSLCFNWCCTTEVSNPYLTADFLRHRVFPRNFTESGIVHICWWNSEFLTIALQNGRILIMDLDQFIQYNSENIALQPFPQVEENIGKTFFALNCLSKSSKNINEDEKNLQVVKISPWNVIQKCLSYLSPDDQLATTGNVDTCFQNYSLIGLRLTTPKELFEIKIEKKLYTEALLLAKQYGLDSDIVFQKQWRDSRKTIIDITNILIQIKKRNWILNECLEQIPEDIESMKFLLKIGFYLTDVDKLEDGSVYEGDLTIETVPIDFRNFTDTADLVERLQIEELSLVQIELIRIRMKLLNYCDKLIVYEQILIISADVFNQELFRELKKLSSFEIAINFARHNNIIGLKVLLDFYNTSISQHILTILSNIPESVKPSTYTMLFENFMPSTNRSTPSLAKELDWCETDKFKLIYNKESTLHEAEMLFYEKNPYQTPFILTPNCDHKIQVRDWCHWRIRKIESETLSVSHALDMLQILKKFDDDIDQSLEFNLRFLYEGVYNCQLSNTFISLSEFELLSDFEKANMLMSKTTPERFLMNFKFWIMPMLEEINIQSSQRSLDFFRDYLLNLGKRHLICARKLIEDKESMEQLIKVIPFKAMIRTYLLLLCEDDDEVNINECANIARQICILIPKDVSLEYISELKQLQDIENYLSVLRILHKYELMKTIKFIHENRMNGELVENLISNMVFHYLKSVKNIDKTIIKSVFTEIQISLSLVFKSVHPTLIYKNLLKSMLESGDKKRINLACGFMILSKKVCALDDIEYQEKLVDFTDAVQCILLAVRNYINASTSSKDSNMLLAKYCLQLVEDSTAEIDAENEIIKCSEFLDKWHCSLVPIELRSVSNRFELLKSCIERNKHLYKEMEEVIEAGHYLYEEKTSNISFKEGEALRLIAQKALSNTDLYNLEIAMSSLIHRNHKPCWKECIMTLKVFDYPIEKKYLLAKYAVTYCPDSELTETVRAVNDIELSTMTLSELKSKDDSQTTANTNTNSTIIAQPIKFLSLGLFDLSSKINIKSIIDKSSETLQKITTQVSQLGLQGTQELLYKDNSKVLNEMSLDLFYRKDVPFSLKYMEDNKISDIIKVMTLSPMTQNEKSQNNEDQMHFRLMLFNLNRDTYLAIVHAMHISDIRFIYNFRNDLPVNTYTRALIYCMISLNLILKYRNSFLELDEIITDEIETYLQPLVDQMSEDEQSILCSISQEFKDYSLLDDVVDHFPGVSPVKFFSSVDYRKMIISQLSVFSAEVKLFQFAKQMAHRYNVNLYDLFWNYFISFVTNSSLKEGYFDENYNCFLKVFDTERFVQTSPSFVSDLEKKLASDFCDHVSEFKIVLKLFPEQCYNFLLFNKTQCEHRKWIDVFDIIFKGSSQCNYIDLCTNNSAKIIECLKLVVNSENVKLCNLLFDEFDLSKEFTKIKNEFSSVLANQTLWSKTSAHNSVVDNEEIYSRFVKSLENFSINDSDHFKDFLYNILFQRNEIYISPVAKISILKCAYKFVESSLNGPELSDFTVGHWSNVSLEVTIWLDHVENTVVKVVEQLRQLPSISDKVVVTAEYMPPDNYWQCLLTEMLMLGTSYQDLFTLTWDLSIDSVIIEDSIFHHIRHIYSSKYLPFEGITEKLLQILEELDDYMESGIVEGILERILEYMKDSKERIHRMLLDELIFRARKNSSKSNFPTNQHIFAILKSWGLPVNEKLTFQKNNLHIVDALMQDCDSPEKMEVIPKVIELIELVEEDNNLWQCWIKTCVIKGVDYCSFIFEQFENLKTNKLYKDRVKRLAKDAVQSLTAFNAAEAISISILMDPSGAVDKVQSILLPLKSDPIEYTRAMKNINIKALKMIVDAKLVPCYAQSLLYQRLVNYLTREMDDTNTVHEVLEQLKENNLRDEATWLTSSSSHINPAMKTIEMVSGFWKRFSTGNNT